MDAGASIVAFIGLGLQSVKVLYQFFSGIKDGPEKVADLSKALARLHATYEQSLGVLSLVGVVTAAPSLVEVLTECQSDVKRHERKLQKLSFSSDDGIHRRLWRKQKSRIN